MSESRFERWSRRKAKARTEAARDPAERAAAEAAQAAQLSEAEAAEAELAVNESLTEAEVLEKYDLPDPDTLEKGADITGFLRKEVPEMLRRRALRALWKSNPVLACLDGLNDYDEDFTDAATAMKGFQTIYKVGEGLVDKSKRALAGPAEPAPAVASEAAADDATAQPAQDALNAEEPAADEPLAVSAQAEQPAVRAPAFPDRSLPETEETGVTESPRYRPRMRFST